MTSERSRGRRPSRAFAAAAAVLVSVWAPRCVEVTPGIEVDVELSPQARTAPANQVVNNLGYSIELDSAALAVGGVELVPCGALPPGAAPFLSVAQAHTSSSPFKSGTPIVLDLLAEEKRRHHLGKLKPPPGDYCELEIHFLPADDDATDLPVGALGETLVVSGRWVSPDGLERAFEVVSAFEALSTVTLFTSEGVFELDEVTQEPLVVHISIENIFADVDFKEMGQGAVEALIKNNILSTIVRGAGKES